MFDSVNAMRTLYIVLMESKNVNVGLRHAPPEKGKHPSMYTCAYGFNVMTLLNAITNVLGSTAFHISHRICTGLN